jgi:Mlc titration factor MtfA (ptsG expression regulator)
MREAAIFRGLSAVERAHLRELTTLFLHRKAISGVQGLTLSAEMAVVVAAQACLPILKLGLDYYDGWVEVVIYPGAFRVVRDHTDATGLVSHEERALSGESWLRGPVILSWDDVAADLAASQPGHNVVVHEFAHKLDMLNGNANGMPPLHTGMVQQQWTAAFSDAFDSLQQQLSHHHRPDINPYAATAPAEYFAVASEYFFTDPRTLRHQSSAVYDQLMLFYRQDPASRQPESGRSGASGQT